MFNNNDNDDDDKYLHKEMLISQWQYVIDSSVTVVRPALGSMPEPFLLYGKRAFAI